MPLKIAKELRGPRLHLKLSGSLDEDITLQSVVVDGLVEVTIDLEALAGINSIGIREWVRWTKRLGTAQLRLQACPRVFVDQINLVAGMLPDGGVVESFFVPYYCEDEDHEIAVRWTRGREYDGGKVLVDFEERMEGGRRYVIDVDPVRYLAFVKRFG